jgi:hypothetical protein
MELLLISLVKTVEKYLVLGPRTGTKFEMDSQGKLTKRSDAKMEKFYKKTNEQSS